MTTIIQNYAESYIRKLFLKADIIIDGDRPWDIQVKRSAFYHRLMLHGSMGLGESYLDNMWQCEALDQFFYKLLRADLHKKGSSNLSGIYNLIKARFLNRQCRKRSFQVGEEHYDVGNDLFQAMLDDSLTYSCGYWKQATTLEQAQRAKLDMICRKLKLTSGMRLLDIGCGWGSLVHYAAQKYGVTAVGVTVSKEQAMVARKRCAGLPVDILLQDYRELTGTFDAVASVGMFEHVGYKNYSEFMNVVNRCLHENGLFLLHTIGANRSQIKCDDWFDKYIFPNGMLPSVLQVASAIEENFTLEDWHNLGVDYDKTLICWYRNFERNWDRIKTRYSERFFRMWRYYLLSLAGGFRARHMQVWQIVVSPKENIQDYTSVRCPDCCASARVEKESILYRLPVKKKSSLQNVR